MTPLPRRCANPQCGHIEAVHYLGRCKWILEPCSCEAFVEPGETA